MKRSFILSNLILGLICSCGENQFQSGGSNKEASKGSNLEAKLPENGGTSPDSIPAGPDSVIDLPQEEVRQVEEVNLPIQNSECSAAEGDEYTQSFNDNNGNPVFNVSKYENILVNGNENEVTINLNSAAQINKVCLWVNGNDNNVTVNVTGNVKELYLGLNGNNGDSVIQLLQTGVVNQLYHFVDGVQTKPRVIKPSI
ncbi:hypothetical protein [Pseudobacteriovorax antillogorgiicola]|uniref:Lipoprotein n=1 Tax=Pseudobacteriovorax antillogorgiicola TaxID=1513793 RepID=A0A1Y6B7X7_9BACT|nr:hypothetical protein [Pseudobacteriovorax antillogorgiicola]TCS58551.1 hypothetical protein EDD56_10264 [Pseudobacteriovorax antillogorgiicola]SME97680.1 hypothetical protein SAMN06296036_102379 [Pseudobacteriovorax antillogorgiicola]